ncbi:hypothetical protein C8Q70DRAFT_937393, partial [Cubamyces menziesii]
MISRAMAPAHIDPPDSRMPSASTSEDDEEFASLLAFAKALSRRPHPEMADWYLKFKRLMRDVRITSSHDQEFEEHLFARIEAECARDVAKSFMSTYAIRSRRWDVKVAQALVDQAADTVAFYKGAISDMIRATPNPNVRDRVEDFIALNTTLRNAEDALTRASEEYDAAVIRYDEAYRTRQIRPLRAPHTPPRNVPATSGSAV